MNPIQTRSEVVEIPDKNGPYRTVVVRNHWNEREKVVIEVGDLTLTVVADQMIKAIKNAQNAHE